MSALKFKLLEASAYPNCFSDVTHHSFLVFVRSMLQADQPSLLRLASLQHRHLQRSLLLQGKSCWCRVSAPQMLCVHSCPLGQL